MAWAARLSILEGDFFLRKKHAERKAYAVEKVRAQKEENEKLPCYGNCATKVVGLFYVLGLNRTEASI